MCTGHREPPTEEEEFHKPAHELERFHSARSYLPDPQEDLKARSEVEMAVKNGPPAGDEVAPARAPAQEPGLERETTTHVCAPADADTSPATLAKVISYIAAQCATGMHPLVLRIAHSALRSGILRRVLQPHSPPFTALSAPDESKLSTQLGCKTGL